MEVFTMFMDWKTKYCNILILSLDSMMCQLKKNKTSFGWKLQADFKFFFFYKK